jgi:hypothetical protein
LVTAVQVVLLVVKVQTVEIQHLALLLPQVVAVADMIQVLLEQLVVVAVRAVVVAVQALRPEAQELKDKEMRAVQELVAAYLLAGVAEVLAQLVLTQSLIKVETEVPAKTSEYRVFQNGMPEAVAAEYTDRVVLVQAARALAAAAAIMPVMVLTVYLAPVAVAVVLAVEILIIPKAEMAAQGA